jgi:hypothetical protein
VHWKFLDSPYIRRTLITPEVISGSHILPKTDEIISKLRGKTTKGLGKKCHACDEEINALSYFAHLGGHKLNITITI